MLTLYYAPNTCALASHIALEEAALPSKRDESTSLASAVAAIYIILNVVSFVTDEIGGSSQVSLWKYALTPLHCACGLCFLDCLRHWYGPWVAAPRSSSLTR
jgi:hypothetical protein